jgi:excisionase family DNA binding protein
MTMFEVIADLQHQAAVVRATHPEVAARLEADAVALLALMAPQSVAVVARVLGLSRPTIYDWIDKGYLRTVESGRWRTRVDPDGIVRALAVVREWRDTGGEGRPGKIVDEWRRDQRTLRDRRSAARCHRMGAATPEHADASTRSNG